MGTLSLLGQMTYQLKDKFTLFQGTEATSTAKPVTRSGSPTSTSPGHKAPFTVTYGLQVIAKTNDIETSKIVGGIEHSTARQLPGHRCGIRASWRAITARSTSCRA